MVGNEPCHRGPCKYADVARPSLCTKGDHPKARATGPPTICHHTPPTRVTRDDEHHPPSAGPRHQAHPSSRSHSFGQYSGWRRYIVSHRPSQACHPAFGSS